MKEEKTTFRFTGDDINTLLSFYPPNKENFYALVRLMRRNVVIPFLGAGFSQNFGYPSWDSFIREQANNHKIFEAITYLDSKQYEKAASKLQEQLDGNMEYALLQTFGDHVYKNVDVVPEIELIPKLFRNLILTTNFDEVVELLYAKVNGEYIEKLTPQSLQDTKLIYKRIACGEPTLIKLHGDIATREFVLTEGEYNNTYGKYVLDLRLPLPAFLRDVLLSKVILFLGCSLEDDRTLQVIEQAQIDGSISFALLPLPAETENELDPWHPRFDVSARGKHIGASEAFEKRVKFLNAHNIIPIWYPYGFYDAFKIFIKAIADEVNAEYHLSVTTAHNTLHHLLEKGNKFNEKGDTAQAFQCYVGAEDLIKTNSNVFSKKQQIEELMRIKKFYENSGYIYERREIIKELLHLTGQDVSCTDDALAVLYHDIGYTFERYRYYRLMLKAMLRSCSILRKHQGTLKSNSKPEIEQDSILDCAATVYISLGYAYLKNSNVDNSNVEHAKYWYQVPAS